MDIGPLEICSGDPFSRGFKCDHRRNQDGQPGGSPPALVSELTRGLVDRLVWDHSAVRDRSLCFRQAKVPVPKPDSDRVIGSADVSANTDPDGVLSDPELRWRAYPMARPQHLRGIDPDLSKRYLD